MRLLSLVDSSKMTRREPGHRNPSRSGLLRRAAAAAGLLTLWGCGPLSEQWRANSGIVRGIRPNVEDIDFAARTAEQTRLIDSLKERAQLSNVTLGPEDVRWALVMRAGIQMIDGHCDRYLDTLYRFNREQRAARQGLSAVNAATAGILGLTGVAGPAVSIVATAFGLAGSLFDAGVNSVLFEIEPSALRNVAVQGRARFLQDLEQQQARRGAPFNTRPDVMIALQGYLTQCSPAAIEANINNAASGSPNVVTTPPGTGRGVTTGTPSIALTGIPFQLSAAPATAPRPTPAVQFLAPNRQAGEDALTRGEVQQAQRALGLSATGDPGPAGSAFRTAVTQMQRAMRARTRDPAWDAEPAGILAGRLTREAALVGPMPAAFATPFERYYLTIPEDQRAADGSVTRAYSVLDPARMRMLRLVVLGLPATAPAGEDAWLAVRAALATKRQDFGLARPGEASPGRLDAELFQRLGVR
jgi:hypothetical protein